MSSALVADWKAKAKAVDALRKLARDRLDALKSQIRQPLTDYGQAEADRQAWIRDLLEGWHGEQEADEDIDPAEVTSAAIARIDTLAIDPDLPKRQTEAQQIRDTTLYQLHQKREHAQQVEAERARVAQEKAEREQAERKAHERQITEQAAAKANTFEAERGLTGQKKGQKSGKAGRVPMNQQARESMLARARFRAEHCPGAPWVFCRKDGSRIECIKKGFTACVRDAGLTDVHPHDLRRTFGSWLVQAGVGIERVSELLRHSDIAITARVHAHLRRDDLASAAAILDHPTAVTEPKPHTEPHTNRQRGMHK
jgi:multidrug efflux pump subunit AcrA (membrane-fusion protein)